MIERKKKICKDCKQEKYIFSKGRCQHCATLFKLSNKTEQPKPIILPKELSDKISKIKPVSNINTYSDSFGNRWTSTQIELKINQAKEEKIQSFIDEHGYIFCEDCNVSNSFKFDCSHEISVKEAKELGQVELAWDVLNIKLRCRHCHNNHDGLT